MRDCDAVVHLIGSQSGSVASEQAMLRLLDRFDAEGRPFLHDPPDACLVGGLEERKKTDMVPVLKLATPLVIRKFS